MIKHTALKRLVKSYLNGTLCVELNSITISSNRTAGALEVKASGGSITQSECGKLSLEVKLAEQDYALLKRSQDNLLKLNRKCIHRHDALQIKGVTKCGTEFQAVAFSANTSMEYKLGVLSYYAKPSLHECTLRNKISKDKSHPDDRSKVSFFFRIKSPSPPLSDHAGLGHEDVLSGNFSGPNCQRNCCQSGSIVQRDANTLMSTEELGASSIDETRLSIGTALSFISGTLNECIGTLQISEQAAVFSPTPRDDHSGAYPSAIFYRPHERASSSPYWSAFSLLKALTLNLKPKSRDRLRRAIGKPLEISRNCPMHIRIVLLLIAIECLAKEFLSTDKGKYKAPDGLDDVLTFIEKSGAPKETIERVKKPIEAMRQPGPRNILEEFCKRTKLTTECATTWHLSRNKLAHGEGLDYDDGALLMLQYDRLLMLYHCIVADVMKYEGPIRNHLQDGELSNLRFNNGELSTYADPNET